MIESLPSTSTTGTIIGSTLNTMYDSSSLILQLLNSMTLIICIELKPKKRIII